MQPFIATGDFGPPKEFAAPGREWRPGSTLYLAWRQTRNDSVLVAARLASR